MPRMSQQQPLVETQTNTDESPRKWGKIKQVSDFVVSYFQWVYLITKVYILWIFIHYISVKLYVKYCVPSSLWGFIISPLLISSPHCKAMRWTLHTGATTIDNMWNTIGVWFSSKLLQIN